MRYYTPQPFAGRLRSIARLAKWFSLGSAAVTFAYTIYCLLTPAALWTNLLPKGVLVRAAPGESAMIVAAMAWLIPVTFFLLAMIVAAGLFALLEKGQVFSERMAHQLTWLGSLALASAVSSLLSQPVISLLLSSRNPAHERQLLISASSGDLVAIVMACLLFAFALIMREATRIDEDNRGFI